MSEVCFACDHPHGDSSMHDMAPSGSAQSMQFTLNASLLQVMCIALQLLQKLVLSSDQIGEALVPYYRQARIACTRKP